jgi:hypothetical protein
MLFLIFIENFTISGILTQPDIISRRNFCKNSFPFEIFLLVIPK